MKKINALGGKVTLGGDVVPASDTLTRSVQFAADERTMIKTIYIEDKLLITLIEGNRGILIDPYGEEVVVDTIIPDDRLNDALDYLIEDFEDGVL